MPALHWVATVARAADARLSVHASAVRPSRRRQLAANQKPASRSRFSVASMKTGADPRSTAVAASGCRMPTALRMVSAIAPRSTAPPSAPAATVSTMAAVRFSIVHAWHRQKRRQSLASHWTFQGPGQMPGPLRIVAVIFRCLRQLAGWCSIVDLDLRQVCPSRADLHLSCPGKGACRLHEHGPGEEALRGKLMPK